MGRIKACCSQKTSLITMILMTTFFFFLEIIVGYVTNSMALVADSFHMLSDVVSLFVGFFALKISQERSERQDRNTFGWARAEVLGALVNAVFLVALCFSIIVEAMKRLVQPETIDNPILVLIVGAAGLLVNIMGMCIFQGHVGGHGHSHGPGNSHSHGTKQHKHKSSLPTEIANIGKVEEKIETVPSIQQGFDDGIIINPDTAKEMDALDVPDGDKEDTASVSSLQVTGLPFKRATGDSDDHFNLNSHQVSRYSFRIVIEEDIGSDKPAILNDGEDSIQIHTKSDQMNMKAVYLHVLGDALGSIIVIVSVLIIYFVKSSWTMYVDPVMSIIMVTIILKSSIPLLKESSMILLQTVPTHIHLTDIKKQLLGKFPTIIEVHEFHVWQLAGSKIIASLHIKFSCPTDYIGISEGIKLFFHNRGIHSTTIQPEFLEDAGNIIESEDCLMKCVSRSCAESTCCTVEGIKRRPQGSSHTK